MSTTSDKVGAQAQEVSKDLKEIGDIVRDAAQTERQAPTEFVQMVMQRAHPSNYPSFVDVRPTLQRVPLTNPVDAANSNSN
jgi:hypothetical protein